ncbi:glycoside hydrolase family 5 protein [Streptomyces radicis]|uniref:cellulase n=1 Tax=Streptomyces radicis TaxID=1750517 RepID=A0A3A9VYA1_9ACTN|nr:glycoside hydrolase family 5 protein [Streptomyces radicis]RKN05719.1 glycoside hydrolase family 5 protein [Streptomyces radicis]RKN17559.1 glycoside hydrolase family 5 protein [Streptomyces radicis]
MATPLSARPSRRRRALLAAAGLLAVCAATAVTAPTAPAATAPATAATPGAAQAAAEVSPLAQYGALEVCGTTLCGENGQPVQLRGMSTHGTQWFEHCVTPASLDVLANDWGADVLRVSTYVQEDGYETDPEYFTDLASRIIDQATERGMYVIVDWHMLSPGDPNANTDLAKRFFTDITARHGDQDNLLYEIANEPSGVPWSSIKSYAEEMVPVVRAGDPDAVVLVGTRAWSSLGVSEGSDESEVVADPVNADNIMYTFHFYAASHQDAYLAALSRAADQLPMFVTEFGTQEYTGDGPDDFASAQRYLDLLAEKNISWTNWNYSDDFRTGAVFETGTCSSGNWADPGALKEAGVWIRDRIG